MEAGVQRAHRRYQETADGHTDDFDLQFAAALTVPPPKGSLTLSIKVERLRVLAQRFRGHAGLHATILRYATQSDVQASRNEANLLVGEPALTNRPGVGV